MTTTNDHTERAELSDDAARDMALKAGGDDFAFRNRDGDGWTLKYCFRLSELKKLIQLSQAAALLEAQRSNIHACDIGLCPTDGNCSTSLRSELKPLTDEQIATAWISVPDPLALPFKNKQHVLDFARAIESKLREKNAGQPADDVAAAIFQAAAQIGKAAS